MIILFRILTGFIFGYLAGSFLESLLHRYILHASSKRLKFWKKNSKIFGFLYEEYVIHNIHHFKTFKIDGVTQFVNNHEQQQLDERLILKGPEFVDHVKRTQYGLRAQPRGLMIVSIFVSIFFAIPIYLIFGRWFFIGTIPGIYFLPYFMSRIIHPFSHLPYDLAVKEKSSGVIKSLLKTKYIKRIIRYHYIHHQYINCNYNLVLGADYLLKWNRKSTPLDEEEMNRIGINVE